jgi:cytochrome P450
VAPGSQVVLSPKNLHRHTRLWDNPDGFDPERWHSQNAKHCQRAAFIPFSAGPRVCTGAGFAMLDGVLLLARLCAAYEFKLVAEQVPQPVAHLTVRSKKGIWLKLRSRGVLSNCAAAGNLRLASLRAALRSLLVCASKKACARSGDLGDIS